MQQKLIYAVCISAGVGMGTWFANKNLAAALISAALGFALTFFLWDALGGKRR